MPCSPRLRAPASRLARPLVICGALLVGACAGPSASQSPPDVSEDDASGPADDKAQAPASAAPAASDTGPLSEEAFKALHELTGARAPAPRGEMIELAGARAYLSLPRAGDQAAAAPLPGVVVIHEWWGLNEHIQHWTDRLAADGYAALAVDLYGGGVATDPNGAMALMKAVDEARAQEILTAAHAFLASDSRVQATRRGVIGWCFGGGWSLRHAIATQDLDAAVIYYGRPIEDPALLGSIHAELLGVFGNQDKGIPPEAVERFVGALKQAGKRIELHQYDANHAFANPSSARYDEPAASDAWTHVRAFLARTLKGA